MWPFRKLTPEQIEEREWRRYRNRLYSKLVSNGYRGDPVDADDAWDWACRYVAEARKQQADWRAHG